MEELVCRSSASMQLPIGVQHLVPYHGDLGSGTLQITASVPYLLLSLTIPTKFRSS